MYGGDEVNALVLDIGSATVKAGYAGEDTPKAVFPSAVGIITREADGTVQNGDAMETDGPGGSEKPSSRQLCVGSQALAYRRDQMEVVPALKQGLYDDWDLIEALWDHTFRERLNINPAEHPLLFAEPSFNPAKARERMVETLFEKYQPPALFVAKNAVLSSFAVGKQTSLTVDLGHEGTVVAAVHDGYVLQRTVSRAPLGGALLSRCMALALEARGTRIRPRYSFKRRETQPGLFEVVEQSHPGTTDSYRRWCEDAIAADVKEAVCRVSDLPFDAAENANIPTVTYELPDGTDIQVGPDRFSVPEVLFQPKVLASFPGMETVKNYDGGDLPSVTGLVMECINKSDVDIRRELFNNVILTGGSALFTQVRERLERELMEAAPQTAKVKVISPANSLERRFSVWLGGSILASLGSFQQMWMSQAEYDEHGASLIHRKAP